MVPVLDQPVTTVSTAASDQLLPHSKAIEVAGLTVSYPVGRKQTKNILHSIDFTVAQGEFLVLLGQTGCGKSTLLRTMLGQEFPTSGLILVDGKRVSRVGASCGYVPQRYSLFPDRTVLGNLMMGPETSSFHILGRLSPGFRAFRRTLRAKALTQLEQMGLHPADAAKYPHQLSGGMQQRVAIAQALMMHPRILLMDEAFSALDPGTRGNLQRMLRDIWLKNKPTVVFVTHNTAEALFLGTRIMVLGKTAPEENAGSHIVLDLKLPESGMNLKRDGQKFIDFAEHIESCSQGSLPPYTFQEGSR